MSYFSIFRWPFIAPLLNSWLCRLNYKHPLMHRAEGLDELGHEVGGDSEWGQHNDYA